MARARGASGDERGISAAVGMPDRHNLDDARDAAHGRDGDRRHTVIRPGGAALIRKLTYLLSLARERHFGRAATASHVSQPTLSNAIRQLEEDLRVPIVLRGRVFQGFTPEGEKVLDYARQILADCTSLRRNWGLSAKD